jgi:hypothetical protein
MAPAISNQIGAQVAFIHRGETTRMLAEKFFLLLEMLKARSYPDGGPRVASTSPHIPVKLPHAK